jgi:hypothetical protein
VLILLSLIALITVILFSVLVLSLGKGCLPADWFLIKIRYKYLISPSDLYIQPIITRSVRTTMFYTPHLTHCSYVQICSSFRFLPDCNLSSSQSNRVDFTTANNKLTVLYVSHALRLQDLFCRLCKTSKTPWLVVRKRTVPTERPPLISVVSANFCG